MNRYDCVFMAFRLLVESWRIHEVRNMVNSLANTTMDQEKKYDYIIETLFKNASESNQYIARALIELALAQIASQQECVEFI